MAGIVPFRRPQPSVLSRVEFKRIVVEMVGSGALKVGRHLNRDHPERAISQAQIERCLEMGTVQTDPYVNKYGNFQAEVFRHMAGHQLTVVAAIEWELQVVVVTAFE
jgi:hypothetical protein